MKALSYFIIFLYTSIHAQESAETLKNSAQQCIQKQQWQEAINIYKQLLPLLQTNQEKAKITANLGGLCAQQSSFLESIKWYQQSVDYQPSLAASWSAMASVHETLKDDYLALSCYCRAVHEDPSNPDWHNALAVAAKKLGWADMAEFEWQKTLQIKSNFALAHFNLTLLYLEKTPPMLELAKKHYSKALALGTPPDAWIEDQIK